MFWAGLPKRISLSLHAHRGRRGQDKVTFRIAGTSAFSFYNHKSLCMEYLNVKTPKWQKTKKSIGEICVSRECTGTSHILQVDVNHVKTKLNMWCQTCRKLSASPGSCLSLFSFVLVNVQSGKWQKAPVLTPRQEDAHTFSQNEKNSPIYSSDRDFRKFQSSRDIIITQYQ